MKILKMINITIKFFLTFFVFFIFIESCEKEIDLNVKNNSKNMSGKNSISDSQYQLQKTSISENNIEIKKQDSEQSWVEILGGKKDEKLHCIRELPDNNFIAIGATSSKGAGGMDGWIIKMDGNGNIYWDKTIGGEKDDELYSIENTGDGGIVTVGYTESSGAGARDGWIVKLNKDGKVEWERTYGGIYWDELHSIINVSPNGFLAAGYCEPQGAGSHHILLLRIDNTGKILWSKTYSKNRWDEIESLTNVSSGGFIASGYTEEEGRSTGYDAWILKVTENVNIPLKNINFPGKTNFSRYINFKKIKNLQKGK